MKIGICGAGPLAIESACRLHQMGAQVIVFGDLEASKSISSLSNLNEELQSCQFIQSSLSYISQSPCLSLLTADQKNEMDKLSGVKKVGFYFSSLTSYLIEKNLCRPFKVLQVNKAFLNREQVPAEKSRFFDMFRIIYEVNHHSQNIDRELSGHLPNEIVNALSKSYDAYADVDVVVDATGYDQNLASGNSGEFTVGERALLKNRKVDHEEENRKIFYNYNFLSSSVFKELAEVKNKDVLVVGNNEYLASFVSLLKESNFFDKEKYNKLLILKDTENLDDNISLELNQKFNEILDYFHAEYQKEQESFQTEINRWKALEPYEQVKVAKPNEPVSSINIIDSISITSIDKLDDKDELFVTLERPSFLGDELFKTLSFENIFVFRGFKKNYHLYSGLNQSVDKGPNETGFYSFYKNGDQCFSSIEHFIKRMEFIETDLQKLFSPK